MKQLLPRQSVACLPLILSCIVALVNSFKPVVVDDTAYLGFARQISAHPFDPYGFTFFWYTVPQEALEILCPPVVPYWLAVGIRVFGERPALLKLWMFPFIWLLAWSLYRLLHRFAAGSERVFLTLLMLSPAILPTVNLMLDIPALALGLYSLVIFIRAESRESVALALIAGLVAGLAMQTKYTALLVPPILGLYGLTRWSGTSFRLALAAIAAAIALFAGWEWLLVQGYGQSHFLFHLSQRSPQADSGTSPLLTLLFDKCTLIPPLVADLGCLGGIFGLIAALTLGLGRSRGKIAAVLGTSGFLWIACTPRSWNWLPMPSLLPLNFATLFWMVLGTLVLIAAGWCSLCSNVRWKRRKFWRMRPDAIFLGSWLLLELAGYFALTPFGAARRIIGLVVIMALIVARFQRLMIRIRPGREIPKWVMALGVLAGVTIAAIDTLDAYPEKFCAEKAASLIAEDRGHGTVWFAGHWGFQFYCQRQGMRQIIPEATVVEPGDIVVLPVYPSEFGFYRPHIGTVRINPPDESVEVIATVCWDDPLSAQTIPNFYGGDEPVIGRDHPRLRVVIERCLRTWQVPGE